MLVAVLTGVFISGGFAHAGSGYGIHWFFVPVLTLAGGFIAYTATFGAATGAESTETHLGFGIGMIFGPMFYLLFAAILSVAKELLEVMV